MERKMSQSEYDKPEFIANARMIFLPLMASLLDLRLIFVETTIWVTTKPVERLETQALLQHSQKPHSPRHQEPHNIQSTLGPSR